MNLVRFEDIVDLWAADSTCTVPLSTFQIKKNTMFHQSESRKGVKKYYNLHTLQFVRICVLYLWGLSENEKLIALAETESMEVAQMPAA
jgi:hypothetical protein